MKMDRLVPILFILSFVSYTSGKSIGCGLGNSTTDGMDNVDDSFGDIDSPGRSLLQNWKPCNEVKSMKIKAKPMKKTRRSTMRRCCVACKNNPPCLAWRWNSETESCALYDRERSIDKELSEKHTSGFLRWRFSDKSLFKELASTTAAELRSESGDVPSDLFDDSPQSSNNSNKDEDDESDKQEEAKPTPPPIELLPGKIIYGTRINSHMPCKGNIVDNAEDCAERCKDISKCDAWSFTDGFNCGWVGEPEPVGLCYMMSDVGPYDIFDAPNGDIFISGWA